MTFDQAKTFVMPFGKHKGRTLEQIASDDEGLQYLDWLFGERGDGGFQLDRALVAYLEDPSIQKELEDLH
jgi:uncharacterized protein (DUF3820 family)